MLRTEKDLFLRSDPLLLEVMVLNPGGHSEVLALELPNFGEHIHW